MDKYDALDALILKRIREAQDTAGGAAPRPVRSAELNATPQISAESTRLADVESQARTRGTSAPAWRIVDRRLQALRKAGRIRSGTTGWLPTTEAHQGNDGAASD